MVPEKAGFILRSDLAGPGSQYFCRQFFPMSGSWRLPEEGELCITELNLAYRVVLASLFCCWYFSQLFLERRRLRRRTEPLQRAHPSTTLKARRSLKGRWRTCSCRRKEARRKLPTSS